ncbi:MAG: biotin transporter BioY [Deferrisomatales bacterium]|nr:biotin transporter BioY [Deferrisomatales bacterium]
MASPRTRDLVIIGLFAALTAVGAFLRVPLEPVPFTLQPLVVFLAGAVLRPRLALGSQLTYLAIGLVGLPVFANGGGPAYVLHPTFGFLVGFSAAAWVIAAVVRWAPGGVWGRTLVGLLLGLGVVYLCGIAGLYLNLALFQGKIEVFRTVVWSLGGYLGFDLVKVGLALVLAAPLRQALADLPAGRVELAR